MKSIGKKRFGRHTLRALIFALVLFACAASLALSAFAEHPLGKTVSDVGNAVSDVGNAVSDAASEAKDHVSEALSDMADMDGDGQVHDSDGIIGNESRETEIADTEPEQAGWVSIAVAFAVVLAVVVLIILLVPRKRHRKNNS